MLITAFVRWRIERAERKLAGLKALRHEIHTLIERVRTFPPNLADRLLDTQQQIVSLETLIDQLKSKL